jgi:hypothetical protein
MTFRPSVVPDRDNDIISTFTRSFERARNLVRSDQADRRAQSAFDLEQRVRTQALEDREFEAGVRRGQPGVFRTDGGAGQAGGAEPIAQALGAAGAVSPALGPDFRGVREVAKGGVGVRTEPSGPADATDVGGGFAFSRRMQREIEAGELREEQEAAEVSPAAERGRLEQRLEGRRLRGEEREAEAAGLETQHSQANALRAQFPDELEGVADDVQVITQGRLLAQQALRATPTGAQAASAGTRRDQSRAAILSNFQRKLATATRTAAAERDPVLEEMARRRGETLDTEIDRGEIMRETIRESAAAGDITAQEAQNLMGDVEAMLTESSATGPAGGILTQSEIEAFAAAVEDLPAAERDAELRDLGLDDDAIKQILGG